MIERRMAQRHKVLKGATIAFGGHGIACTVRNLSSDGAAIDLTGSVNLPPAFTLVIESNRLVRRCHSVWRNDRRLGVAFD